MFYSRINKDSEIVHMEITIRNILNLRVSGEIINNISITLCLGIGSKYNK